MKGEIEIRQTLFDTEEELQQLVDLQNEVYCERNLVFTVDSFKRWYIENPFGRVLSFNAFDGDKMVAHYACIPTKLVFGDSVVDGIHSMATVTHPDYRGKGLFKTLAKLTYDYAKEQGYKFVIGVANANSFPGFIKYFDFKFISQLDVKMGWGTKIYPKRDDMVRKYWDKDAFDWRLGLCRADYNLHGHSLLGPYNSFVQTYMGYYPDPFLKMTNVIDKHWGFRPKLYVGLGAKFKSLYFTVPKFIKHSPFNLIFLDLTDGELPEVTKDNIFFQLFDFDVA